VSASHLVLAAAAGTHTPFASIHYWQAIILGLIQGVTELFPVSSIGHTVVLPALFGWHNVANAQSRPESFWLAFLVGLHVGTALALLAFYRRDWQQIVGGLYHSARRRKITTPVERLGWLLVLATIPAGITGAALEHELRVLFAKPLAASCFLIVNGFILLGGEVFRRRSEVQERRRTRIEARRARVAAVNALRDPQAPPPPATHVGQQRHLASLELREGFLIGVAQVFALIAGISRSGITIVAGLVRGLDHEDAARFSFLLATPVILAAGVYKLPDLLGPLGNGVRGQTVVAALFAGVAAWFSVRFLSRWFTTRTLMPFAVYCLIAGSLLVARFA